MKMKMGRPLQVKELRRGIVVVVVGGLMRDRRVGLARAGMVALVAALAMVGAAIAQNAAPKARTNAGQGNNRPQEQGKGQGKGQGGAAAPGVKARPKADDPLAPDAQQKAGAGSYHYTLKLSAPGKDKATLAATYYPSKLGTNASAVLLIHEKDRSSKDFEEPIADLKGEGLAEHLQGQGHAVLMIDLRGQGANLRRATTPKDWQMMVNDLQAAYQFLIDRTNRGELNLSKLSVIGLGEGANLAAAWAYQPGGAVSNEGRTSDLCSLVLISPMGDGEGLLLNQVLAALAPRFPLLVMVGARDPVSSDPVRAVRPLIERPQYRLSKVETFDSSLHGYKLLRLEPKVTSLITRFLEGTAKYKAVEWEPRFNLAPVPFNDVAFVRNAKAADAAKAKEAPALAPAQDKDKEKEKEKAAPDQPGENKGKGD
jgi:alpha-beta hydrolase superfamily lysophospholipase